MIGQEKIYVFVLGRNHSLSKAEVLAVLAQERMDFEVLTASQEVLVLKLAQNLPEDFLGQLGGCPKLAEVFRSWPTEEFLKKEEKIDFGSGWQEFFGKNREVKAMGLSVYGGGAGFKNFNQAWYLAPRFYRLAQELWGAKIRGLPLRERELPSFLVEKEGLVERGFEMVLAVGEKEVYWGKTIAVQDFEGYSQRDWNRPQKDPRSGMIPPKLAKMMINLAGGKKEEVFWDPFCGSGTFLEEARLLGYRQVWGSDVSARAVEKTKLNLAWLREKAGEKEKSEGRLFVADAANPPGEIREKVAVVATEPYLGNPRAGCFNLRQMEKEVRSLEEFYRRAFAGVAKALKKGGRLVAVWPVFRFRGDFFYLEILKDFEKMGFKKESFLPEGMGKEGLGLKLTKRGSVVFYRPGQTVSREIFIFSKS